MAGFEQLVDSMMGFSMWPPHLGDRIAVLSGPGGLAVAAAEACADAGLRLAKLSSHTVERLSEFVAPTGTSLANPVDVGLTGAIEVEIYIQAARSLAADPEVDAMVVIGHGLTPEANRLYTDSMIQVGKDFSKPFVMVNIPGHDFPHAQEFCEAGMPFFETPERAMSVYAKVRNYELWQRKRQH